MTNYRRSRRLPAGVLAALPVVQPHCLRRKMPHRMRWDDMETPLGSRDYAAVASAAGGGQPRGETVWGWSTRAGGAGSVTRPSAPRGENWLILTDCSNAFNTVKWTAVLAEAATCVPALTPFVAKYNSERPAPVFLQMDSGERLGIDCFSGVQQGDAMGPALFCMPLLPVLKRCLLYTSPSPRD